MQTMVTAGVVVFGMSVAHGATIYSNTFDSSSADAGAVYGAGVSGTFITPGGAGTSLVSPALAGVPPLSGGAGAFSGRMQSILLNSGVGTVNRLSLTGLPAHTSVSLGFLVTILDQWKASQTAFQVFVGDGITSNLVFSSGFDNSDPLGGYTSNRMAWGVSLGGTAALDSAYDLSLESSLQAIPHTSATLQVDWAMYVPVYLGNSHKYGLDNLTISVDGGPVIPLPSAAGLGLAGLGLLASRRRRIC